MSTFRSTTPYKYLVTLHDILLLYPLVSLSLNVDTRFMPKAASPAKLQLGVGPLNDVYAAGAWHFVQALFAFCLD